MTFLKNTCIVLGAVLGIATVYLAPAYLTFPWSKKKSKTNEGKSADVCTIETIPVEQKENDHQEKERESEEPCLLLQNQIIESIIDKTQKAVVAEIALIHNASKQVLENGEQDNKATNTEHSSPSELLVQNNDEQVSEGNALENLVVNSQTPALNPNNEVLHVEEKEKTVKKTYVKKWGEEDINVVEEYVETDQDKHLVEDWKVKFQTMEESSFETQTTKNPFVSIPTEVINNEKLDSTIYESFEDKTNLLPFKPPRIRKAPTSDTLERTKLFSNNISTISSKKPSAQSTLLETEIKNIEIKEKKDIKAFAEESNIDHNIFKSDGSGGGLNGYHNTAGHKVWRRYANVFGNLLSWKKRANDRSRLLDSEFSPSNYGKISPFDAIEGDETQFRKYKRIK